MKQSHMTGKSESDQDTAMTGDNSNVSRSQGNYEKTSL